MDNVTYVPRTQLQPVIPDTTPDSSPSSRKSVWEKFRRDPGEFTKEAKQRKVPLYEVLRINSPVPATGYPINALEDVIAREGLVVHGGDAVYQGSTVADFCKKEYGQTLLLEYLDMNYERTYQNGVRKSLRQTDPNGSTGYTASQFLAGQPYNPYMDQPLREDTMLAPQIPPSMLLANTVTISDDQIRKPRYDTPEGEETMVPVAAGAEIPVAVVTLQTSDAEIKKVGLGLGLTDEFLGNSNRVAAATIWVARVAVRHLIRVSREIVNQMVAAAAADAARRVSGVTKNLEGIIDLNFEFEEPYSITTLIANKATAKEWVKAVVTSGAGSGSDTVGNFQPYPAGRFSDLFGSIRLLNQSSAPTGLGYIEGTNLANDQMLALDARSAVVMYRHARGSINERERITSRQMEVRYLTERYGTDIDEPNSYKSVALS